MVETFLSDSWYRVSGLKPRLRQHIDLHRHRYRGQPWYVLQDHASGKSHRFTPAAYLFILRMDGLRTVDELWSSVVEEMGEAAPSQDEIIQLLSQLHTSDLMQCEIVPDVAEVFKRHSKQAKSGLVRNLKSPLSFRVPLWDPDRFLNRTMPLIRPIFGWSGAITWLLVVLLAAVLGIQHWSQLSENFSDRILAAQSLVIIAVSYPILKFLHELGHGYVAKFFGGEVHEMGVMFLVFFPVPYVDASAATSFPGKYQRALVGAAGIFVELFVAAIALFVWINVEPGWVRAFAYNVVIIASVSTVLFNGNPLLRFDGYYVFADLIEIPNLATRSQRFYGHLIDRFLFRTEGAKAYPATLGERIWFIAYAPAAYIYRLAVLFAIAMFVATQFFVVGAVLAIWAVAMGVVLPVLKLIGHLLNSPRLFRNRGRAISLSAITVICLAAFAFLVPLPQHTSTDGVVWLEENTHLRAGTDGFLNRLLAEPGEYVRAGDALIEMALPTNERTIEVAKWRVEELEAELATVAFEDQSHAKLVRFELEASRAEYRRALERNSRLVIKSLVDGIFMTEMPQDLPGRFYKEGEVIGYVTPTTPRSVRTVVLQDDIELVRHRRRGIKIKFADRLDEIFDVKILREVPTAKLDLPSAALGTIGGGNIIVDPREPSKPQAIERLFQLDLALPEDVPDVPYGSRVYIRFAHNWESIAVRLYRRTRQLFLTVFNV